jgi:Na+-transporting NADH:ubiquinone oxidoreductase subunit A
MSKNIKIRRGADIPLAGRANPEVGSLIHSDSYAIKPTDFHGITPKMLVDEGTEVQAGSPLFYDKYHTEMVISSPVSGEVAEIRRGDKRMITEVVIVADKEIKFIDFGASDPSGLSNEDVRKKILDAGLWGMIKMRPFNVIADSASEPRDIFVSAFDSNPLAPELDGIINAERDAFQAGLTALSRMTKGKVHLTAARGSSTNGFKDVEENAISGPHPAGNVGVQIHHIAPINKGEQVWTVSAQDVLVIGRLFTSGKVDLRRSLAITGSEVSEAKYVQAYAGTSMKNLLNSNLKEGDKRIISGNVLTGSQVSEEGYLGYYDHQITVIPEAGEGEFLGWALPRTNKFSLSHSYFSWLLPKKEYKLDTLLNGEERAFVVTGEYEKVFPMDIHPVPLIKSIMIGDIEAMENLGIYEVAEEDFALCEFGCTSKMELQKIVRNGLDYVKKETH